MRNPPILALLCVLSVFLMLGQAEGVLASTHSGGNAGGLPTLVNRVETVENVLHVEEVELIKYPKIFVGGTEYEPFDPGKTFVQIDINGNPVTNASCFATAWYPDTTLFFDQVPMAYLDRGIYFHDFIVPNIIGVYPVSAKCDFLVDKARVFGENLTIISGNKDSGGAGDTYAIEGNFLAISETVGGQRGFDFIFYFQSVDLDVNTSLITLDTFSKRPRNGNDPDNDFINFWLFNWSSSEYVHVGVGFDYQEAYQREITVLSAGSPDFVNNGTTILLVNDTLRAGDDNKDTLIEFDLLALETVNAVNNASIQVVRGGGEIHVRNSTSIIVEVVEKPADVSLFALLIFFSIFVLVVCVLMDAPLMYFLCGTWFVLFGLFTVFTASPVVGVILVSIGLGTVFTGYSKS